jgi:A/G-specific adenine glycosylase
MDDDLPLNLQTQPARRRFQQRLKAWYRERARDLPWRETSDPYCIWVSEIMLQQTQVATVISYYRRFLERFPTVRELAAADEKDVLLLWEGLGYYRRARQLHAAAKVIVDQHAGEFPRDAESVRELPGIGRYTAGAILSIAYDQHEPILEANTVRLLSRLVGYRLDPTQSKGQRVLWNVAEEILPKRSVGTFNQALMELGSEICVPAAPRCLICPVSQFCEAKRLGLQEKIPARTKRPNYEDVTEAAILIQRRGKILLRRCGPAERWAGLWDFPRYAVRAKRESRIHAEVADKVSEETGLEVQVGCRLKTMKHGVTRFRITLHCYDVQHVSGRLKRNGSELKWVNPDELAEYPLSVTGRKLCRLVVDRS